MELKSFESILAYLDNSQKTVIELQTLLTSIPAIAPESGGQGELEKSNALEKWLKERGFSTIEHFDAPDLRVESGIRPNMVATIDGESDDRTIWIMAHMDVVPVGELSHWNTDPWTVVEKDGKLYGRGVEDNQQGLCSGVIAALAFLENNVTPKYTVKLLFVADEEVGSVMGIQYLLKEHNLFRKQDIIIIPDGGDPIGETVEVAEKTGYPLTITVKGQQVHGSRPDLGSNACLAASALSLKLNDLENVFNKKDPIFESDYSTFQPTKREANVPNFNTIPGEDTFWMDCRILPCYEIADVQAEVKKRISEVEKEYNVSVTCVEGNVKKTPATPVDAPVVVELQKALKELRGIEGKPIGIGGGTVGAYLRLDGFNAAVWSTLEDTMHSPNENSSIKNTIEDAKIFAYIFGGKE